MNDIIKIAMGKMQMALDGEVMKAVQNVGIDVDKDKLLEALQLDDTLVRCKECKWYDNGQNESDSWNYCTRNFGHYIDVNDDDFCSYGEREGE